MLDCQRRYQLTPSHRPVSLLTKPSHQVRVMVVVTLSCINGIVSSGDGILLSQLFIKKIKQQKLVTARKPIFVDYI